MPGINQLPAGSEFAAAISLVWVTCSWVCSSLLLWLAWSHEEGWSYLALISISALISNTSSTIQQGHDITWYTDIVTEQYFRKQKLPGTDPELAIAGGSFGLDLVLYYIQYYNYNVQAMLVMFWAAELCQLTYQVGEKRKIRRIFRKVHVCGKFVSWLLPLVTILCLRIPSLKEQFVSFILIADLPLMLSLAIGSGLMIAVTIRYVQSRQKFTQWTPPKFNSATTSEGGTMSSGTHNSNAPTANTARRHGLYDRWLMVRFTIAFILLAVFEVTNTLFQITALNNNIHDAVAPAPDLSAGRAIETMFLFMPGTTPGIFLFVVFGTTAASRQKFKDKFLPKSWQRGATPSSGGCCFGRRRRSNAKVQNEEGGIHVERSLTITSASRMRASQGVYGRDDDLDLDDDDDNGQFSDPSDIIINISMSDLPKRPDSARSQVQVMSDYTPTYMKPLPLAPPKMLMAPSSKFTTRTVCMSSSNNNSSRQGPPLASNPFHSKNNNSIRETSTTTTPMTMTTSRPAFRGGGGGGGGLGLSAIEEKSSVGDVTTTSDDGAGFDLDDMTRPNTGDSLRVPLEDYYHGGLGPEHSDDSGPILPIQRPEVRFAPADMYYDQQNHHHGQEKGGPGGKTSRRDRLSKNFSRPRQ